jgi:biofilm PGA synthesis protein PgaA
VNKGVLSAVVLVVASDVLLGGIFYHAASAAPDPSDADYSAAIEAARAGNPDAALPAIEERYRAEPKNSSVIYDYILVLGWAKRLMEALSVYESLPPAELPIYLQAAVARDYRDTGAYDKALTLYRQGRARYPQELTFAYGEILTLTDSGHADDAVAQADDLLATHPEDIELLSAAIYASAATDHYADTVALAERMLRIAPQDRDAVRARVFALRGLGQSMLALDLAEQSADAFSDSELRSLVGNRLAALVRAGEDPTVKDTERLAATDRAIAELDRRIAIWAAEGAGGTQEAHTARFDRIVALEDRARTGEVIGEYDALRSQGIEVPAYALKAVADAYARRREPENARRVFELVLAANPKDFEARIGLFYAELESEDFDAAFQTIDALAAEQTPSLAAAGPMQQTPNPAWLRANLIAALARFYAGDTAEAQRRVTDMVILSPNDASLRQALGTILLGRGKPHAADRQFANGQIILPDDVDLAAARANVAITRGDRVEGADEATLLLMRDPAVNAVVQLARRVEILERPELSVRWNANLQSTNIPVAGNSFSIETQLYSAPIDDTYRVYADYGYSVAKLPEGTIVNNHVALGLEYTGLDIAANAEISNDSSPRAHAGGRAAIAWAPLDEWRFSGAMQIFSADTPLRALKHDITANSWMVRAAYTPSDLQSYSLAGELVTFSDGNDRTVLDASALQRLLTLPHLTIDMTGELYASKNSLRNAPYFNPPEDLSGSLTLAASQILYRRYSFVYSHRLSVTGGEYLESGFAGGFAGNLYYEQRLRVNDSWEGALGVQLRRQPYDGHAENSFAILGSIDWRF